MDNDKEPKLKVSCFYWALPVFDVDTNDEWHNCEQPARFAGYDSNGEATWYWMDVEGTDWPARWVGNEIRN